MSQRPRVHRANLRLLLGSSSVVALLIGGGTPAALAAPCVHTISSSFDNPSGHTTANVCVDNASFTGNITNEGIISPSGIGFVNGTISGSVQSTGVINGGISLDATSKIISTGIAIKISGTTFTGGIINAGTISARFSDILINSVSTFSGNISNSGTISAGRGIFVLDVAQFGSNFAVSGISNSGTISAGLATGIVVGSVSTFAGGISNSGTISAALSGINVFAVSNFTGSISNHGTISAGGGGIRVGFKTSGGFAAGVSAFTGNIVNSGTITAGGVGIQVGLKTGGGFVAGVSTFTGNISNSGKITADTGILIAPGVSFAAGNAIVNSGTITGTGGTAIDASNATSAVTIDQTGGLVSGAIKLSANADVLAITGGSIAGNIVGKGSLDTVNFNPGAGNTFTYGGSFSGIHQADVTSGTAVLNGHDTATGMTVSSGGTLAGTGAITSSIGISSGGTLAPGTPGTAGTNLNVSGSVSFASGADYLDTISGASASATAITGTATLGGATVTIAGGSTVNAGTQYTILTDTGGGLGGSDTFNPTVNYGGMVGTLTYNADNVFVNFAAPSCNGPGFYTGTIPCILVANTTFFGSVGSSGTISPGGINIESTAKIVGNGFVPGVSTNAITVTGPTFAGGITNAGTLSGGFGILVAGVPQFGSTPSVVSNFSGGITNTGKITANTAGGISVGNFVLGGLNYGDPVQNFSGGITNSGTISAGVTGISVEGVSTFTGGITNSGTISAANNFNVAVEEFVKGILVSGVAVFGSSTAVGGIVNSGLISVANNALEAIGISVSGVSTFWGGITNSGNGTISALNDGILVGGVTAFSGGITNSGMISASGGSGIGLAGVLNFTGNISNSGTITAKTGINVTGSTINGAIIDSGTILATGHGILVDSASKITAATTAIAVSGATFTGGITNAGTISGGDFGILVESIASFAGNISNSGKIVSTDNNGIAIAFVTSLAANIDNSGTISAGHNGILLAGVSTFTGNISNSGSGTITAKTGISIADSTINGAIVDSGTILATGQGILIDSFSKISAARTAIEITGPTFTGGIANAGMITAGTYGIYVSNVAKFGSSTGGGITNSGTISSGLDGIFVVNVTQFGGISNSGTITATRGSGIHIFQVTSLFGGITNTGSISAGNYGVDVSSVANFSGNISNTEIITAKTGIEIAAGVAFAGGAAIVNSGTITGTAGTAIDASGASSAVIIDQTGGLISGAIKLSANADVLDISGGVINGNIVGQGSKDTINFSFGIFDTFTYAHAFGFSGINQVNVNTGVVILAGTNSATTITVNNGGVLQIGDGTDAASVTANNVINLSNVIISHNATLNDAFLNFGNFTDAGNLVADVVNLGTFTIAPGGVFTGGFVIDTGTFTVDAGGTWNKTPVSIGSGYVLNGNQQNVTGTLNNFINNVSPLPANFLPLFTAADFPNAVAQLSGEAATGASTSGFRLMNDFFNLLSDRSFGGGGGGTAIGFAPEQEASFPPDVALAYNSVLKKPPPQSFDQRWTAWGSGYGGYSTLNGNAATGSNNVTASTYGFAGGMDYRASPDLKLGFALGGGGTDWNLAQGLGGGRSDSLQAAVDGTEHWGPAYLSAALAFANHWFTTNRNALGDQLTAKFDGQSYGMRLEGGYRYAVMPTAGVTPYAAVQAQWFHTPSYSETDLTGGGLGLSYNAMTANNTRSELGARFDDLTLLDGMPLMLRARAAWAHDWVSTPALTATFEALPGANFITNGAAQPANSALATAGAELHLTANWSVEAKFDGQFASTSQTYTGTGTLRYSW